MIDLTPLEVRKKKGDFRRTMRGYEPQAVDDFLDLVADRLEQIVREHLALNERVSAIDAQIADYRERERALTEALVSAQEMREGMRQQMEREADLKRREAEAEAESIRATAEQTIQREEENIRRLRVRQSQFVQSYRSFLERELEELAVIAETLTGHKMMAEEATPSKPRAKRAEIAREEPAAPEAQPAPTPPAVPVSAIPVEVITPQPPMAPPVVAIPEPVREAVEPVREPEIEPEPVVAAADTAPFPFDADFDALLDQVPFAPLEEELPQPVAQGDVRTDLNPESPEPDLAELDLIDEADHKDDDNDGWVSTLLEGKGD